MKRSLFYLFMFLLSAGVMCCTQDKAADNEILCRINEYNLPVDDFQIQLAEELELDRDFKLTHKAKQQFLEELIKKELLIQEAKKLKLDRKEKFVRTIERYWESTLIRDLMDLKCEEIHKKISISEEEIQARYKQIMIANDNPPSLEEVHDQLKEELKEKKKTRTLERWINDLRKNARVEINQDLLKR